MSLLIMEELETLVYKFRRAIEKAKENGEEGDFFVKFPAGQCGVTSDLLAQFLIDKGYDSIVYVCGKYYGKCFEDNQTHAWLCVEGKVIDITSDQFKSRSGPLHSDKEVYVGPMNDYYRLFECNIVNIHPHNGFEPEWTNYYELKRLYSIIQKFIV